MTTLQAVSIDTTTEEQTTHLPFYFPIIPQMESSDSQACEAFLDDVGWKIGGELVKNSAGELHLHFDREMNLDDLLELRESFIVLHERFDGVNYVTVFLALFHLGGFDDKVVRRTLRTRKVTHSALDLLYWAQEAGVWPGEGSRFVINPSFYIGTTQADCDSSRS